MPGFSTSITIDDTIQVIIADERVIKDTAAWKRANAIFCPLGPMATRAFLLVTKSALDALTSSSQQTSDKFHTITWKEFYKADDFGGGPGVETRRDFHKMYLVKSQRLFNGGPDDPNALHLVEFCDARGLAAAHSDTASINYNIRSYAQDTDYLDGTEGHTWTTLCTALWDACGVLGAFPGLPYAPHGVPEDARFNGLNAWWSLCNVLEKLDCAVAHNPLAGTYSIVRLGAEQTIDEPANRIIWNAEPQDFPAADIPETVRVYFNNHYRSYGQERDTELTTNWSTVGAGAYVDVATGDTTAVAGTVKAFWDDLLRQLDEDNTLANGAAVTARATERKDNWLQRQRTERRHKIFYGVNALFVGAQVRAVLWRNWGDHQSNALGGTVTEYVGGPELLDGFAAGPGGGGGGGGIAPAAWIHYQADPSHDNFKAADLARHSYPNYPRLPNIVQVFYSGDSAGAPVSANADGFHPGKVRRWVANNLVTLEDCWIRFVDNDSGDVPAINGANYGPARLSGMSTSDGQRLPVYTVRRGAIVVFIEFTLTANMTAGSATATIDQWWGTDEPTSPTVVNDRQGLFTRALEGAKGIAVLDTEDNLFIVLECQSKAGWIWVTLTEDMDGGEAEGTAVNGFKGSQQDVQSPGSTITLYGITGISDNLKSGDKVLALYSSVDDKYYALAKPSTVMWARTQADYEENAGDPRVLAKLVPNRTSTDETGDSFYIYLPRANDHDPNVIASKNIPFLIDANGDAVCVGDYMDMKIGSVMFRVNSTTPAGWGEMDGEANDGIGSGYDARDRFLLSLGTNFSTIGGTGGENPHNHFIGCLIGFDTTGNVVNMIGAAAPEFYAWRGDYNGNSPTPTYDEDGEIVNPDGSSSVFYTANEMPAYLILQAIERLNNASDA